jgi:ParB/RepB/Spo0J family partition protein
MAPKPEQRSTPAQIVPHGNLRNLVPEQIVPSKNNPRLLFDREPLNDLKNNIRQHGVLVPITVYPLRGQDRYGILDGERRHRCCVELKSEGIALTIPANVVDPPSKVAGLLYMFSIHNFREQWELMPTALSLETVMKELGETDTKKLEKLTGLSEPQIERCKKLLQFPKKFQDLSLDPDPKVRIPSNFWIEILPVLDLSSEVLPDLYKQLGRDGLTQKLIDKYSAKQIKSVIHFRKIMEAYEFTAGTARQQTVVERLRGYILDPKLETRRAFDEFVLEDRKVQSAIRACQEFVTELRRYKLQYTSEKDELIAALNEVKNYTDYLIERIKGSDPPPPEPPEEEDK